jgi:hypothetical protein
MPWGCVLILPKNPKFAHILPPALLHMVLTQHPHLLKPLALQHALSHASGGDNKLLTKCAAWIN